MGNLGHLPILGVIRLSEFNSAYYSYIVRRIHAHRHTPVPSCGIQERPVPDGKGPGRRRPPHPALQGQRLARPQGGARERADGQGVDVEDVGVGGDGVVVGSKEGA